MEWTPKTEWLISPLEVHALKFAILSQVKRRQLDTNNHLISTWLTSFQLTALRCAPIPPDLEFLKSVCEKELDYFADFLDDMPVQCDIRDCHVYDHRMGLRLFLEDKLGVQDKFGDTGIIFA